MTGPKGTREFFFLWGEKLIISCWGAQSYATSEKKFGFSISLNISAWWVQGAWPDHVPSQSSVACCPNALWGVKILWDVSRDTFLSNRETFPVASKFFFPAALTRGPFILKCGCQTALYLSNMLLFKTTRYKIVIYCFWRLNTDNNDV